MKSATPPAPSAALRAAPATQTAQAAPAASPHGLDWTQLFFPGPRRVFSVQEMARAGQQPFPRLVEYWLWFNVASVLALGLLERSPVGGWESAGMTLAITALCWLAARWLWRQPRRLYLNLLALLSIVGLGILAALLSNQVPRKALLLPALTALVLLSSLWPLVIYRVQQIEARLRELDEFEREQRMARRLAAAQIQPHFLFNTLASLQHWVDTGDVRAGALLRSFTQYMRATLPMFEHETLPLSDELALVSRYLEIMQARLGERLRWQVQAPPVGLSVELPPGTVLTLVENAIAHAIEPALAGGSVQVRVQVMLNLNQVCVEVEDASDLPRHSGPWADRVGLTNTRKRLAAQFGDTAKLELLPGEGGSLARLFLPTECSK
jgi:hypothetical protein